VVAPKPSASIRARALRRHHKLSFARVSCPIRCIVKLTVTGGGRKALHRTKVVTGTKALAIPPRHGRHKVRVVVDGKSLARGHSRAR
jgi:hypothetical protein